MPERLDDKSSDGEVFLDAELEPIPQKAKRFLWERVVNYVVFKGKPVVGDAFKLRLLIRNNSPKDIPPSEVEVSGFVNEQSIYAPTVVEMPLVKSKSEIRLCVYKFTTYRSGVINIHVEFKPTLEVFAISFIDGEKYIYNKSNRLIEVYVHNYEEIYSAALLYSTFGLLILSVLTLIITWLRI